MGDYRPVCTLTIRNIGKTDFTNCLVELVELSGQIPEGLPIPLVLPTALQLRTQDRGRFILSAGQSVSVPIFDARPSRANGVEVKN